MRNTPKPLTPYSFPWWIVLSFVILLFGVYQAIALMPKYLAAAKHLKEGKEAYNKHDYSTAISQFQRTLEIAPSSTRAKLEIAKAYFSNNDKMDDELAFKYLEGVNLYKSDYEELKKVMPKEYEEYFSTVKTK